VQFTVPAKKDSGGDRHRDTAKHPNDDASSGHEQIEWQSVVHQLDEAQANLMRSRHQGRVDQAAIMNTIACRQQDQPRGDNQGCAAHARFFYAGCATERWSAMIAFTGIPVEKAAEQLLPLCLQQSRIDATLLF
jgi:hypothetical protein